MTTRRTFFQGLGGAAAAMPRLAAQSGPTSAPPVLLRLSSNESAYGPFPSMVRAMAKACERGNYYVGGEAQAVRQRLAELHGAPAASVVLGAGSSEPLRVTTQVFAGERRPPVVAEPTFEAVARSAEIAGNPAVKIPLDARGVHDVEKMVDAARKNSAGMIYLCNPANPTGTIISGQQLRWTVDNLPADTVLVADEAYSDFVDDPQFETALPYVKQGRPVVILKTFSKIYGLAGMRLGYAIASPDLIRRMAPRLLGGMALNQAVVAGALAGLEDKAEYQRIRALNAQVRRYVTEEFRKMGYASTESQANFVMVDLKRPIGPVSAGLNRGGFAVGRLFPSMPHHLRITLGTMEDMKRFMPLVRAIATEAQSHRDC